MDQPNEVVKKCDCCGFQVFTEDQTGYSYCSDFCVSVSDEEKALWKAGLQEGGYHVWPCQECGQAVEGEWTPSYYLGAICSSCTSTVRARKLEELLVEAQQFVPSDLGKKIAGFLRQ